MLIDQQAAHERILFERFLQHLESRQGASQQSLFPQTVTLNSVDFELVKELLNDIQSLGFQIREFGKNTLIIEGVPADIGTNINELEILEHLLEGFKNNQSALKLNKRESLARALARNTAIKSGQHLSSEEMNALIDELFACEMPNISLSGKPVISTFTLEELLQRFEK
jgi:DNA mismatch repair protein MutL